MTDNSTRGTGAWTGDIWSVVPWGAPGRMSIKPKAHPKEFRDDVVAVEQCRKAGVPIKRVTQDFGISETCLQNWLRKAEITAGHRPGITAAESEELWDLRKRSRVLEREDGVLRRAAAYLLQASLLGKGSNRSRASCPPTVSPSRSRIG